LSAVSVMYCQQGWDGKTTKMHFDLSVTNYLK